MKFNKNILDKLAKDKGWISPSHEKTIQDIENLVKLTSLREDQDNNLLEFGFGNARSTYLLSPYFKNIVGVESETKNGWRDSHACKTVKKELGDKFNTYYSCSKEDIKKKPFYKENCYDYVCFFNICYSKQSKFNSYNSIEEFINGYVCNIEDLTYMIKDGGYVYFTFLLQKEHQSNNKWNMLEILDKDENIKLVSSSNTTCLMRIDK